MLGSNSETSGHTEEPDGATTNLKVHNYLEGNRLETVDEWDDILTCCLHGQNKAVKRLNMNPISKYDEVRDLFRFRSLVVYR